MEHIPFNETQIVDSRLFHVDVCGLKGVSNKIDTTVRINVVKTTSDYAIDFYSGFSDNFLSFAFNLNKEIAKGKKVIYRLNVCMNILEDKPVNETDNI